VATSGVTEEGAERTVGLSLSDNPAGGLYVTLSGCRATRRTPCRASDGLGLLRAERPKSISSPSPNAFQEPLGR